MDDLFGDFDGAGEGLSDDIDLLGDFGAIIDDVGIVDENTTQSVNVSDGFEEEIADFVKNDVATLCVPQTLPFLDIQVVFVGFFGSFLALVGVFESLLLMHLFLTRPHFRKSTFVYLACLSALDFVHCLCYLLVMVLVVMGEWLQSAALMAFWYSYVVELTALDFILICSGAYFLVSASLERFLSASWSKNFSAKGRAALITGSIFWAILFHCTIPWEMKVHHRPNCSPLQQWTLVESELAKNPFFASVWAFWIRNMINIFIPFAVLIILNLLPMLRKKRPQLEGFSPFRIRRLPDSNQIQRIPANEFELQLVRNGDIGHRLGSERGSPLLSLRAEREKHLLERDTPVGRALRRWIATARKRVHKASARSLVLVVIEYLVSNGFSILLTTWELVDISSLANLELFYTLSSDIVSLLTVVSSVSRLPIYWLCDVTFRKEVRWMFRSRLKPRSPPTRSPTSPQFANFVQRLIEERRRNNNDSPSSQPMSAQQPQHDASLSSQTANEINGVMVP